MSNENKHADIPGQVETSREAQSRRKGAWMFILYFFVVCINGFVSDFNSLAGWLPGVLIFLAILSIVTVVYKLDVWWRKRERGSFLYSGEVSWLLFLLLIVGISLYSFGYGSAVWSFPLAFFLFCWLMPGKGKLMADKLLKTGESDYVNDETQLRREANLLSQASFFPDKKWEYGARVCKILITFFVADILFVLIMYKTEWGMQWLSMTEGYASLVHINVQSDYEHLAVLAAGHNMMSLQVLSFLLFVLIFIFYSHKLLFLRYSYPLSMLPGILRATTPAPAGISPFFQDVFRLYGDQPWWKSESCDYDFQNINKSLISRLRYCFWFVAILAGAASLLLYSIFIDGAGENLLYFFADIPIRDWRDWTFTLAGIIACPYLSCGFVMCLFISSASKAALMRLNNKEEK